MAKLLIIQLLSYQACMLCGIIMSTPFQMGAWYFLMNSHKGVQIIRKKRAYVQVGKEIS